MERKMKQNGGDRKSDHYKRKKEHEDEVKRTSNPVTIAKSLKRKEVVPYNTVRGVERIVEEELTAT